LVQDAAVKEKLADRAMLGAGNQFRTKDASIVAFFLSDLEVTKRINRIQQLEKGKRDPNYMNMLPIVSSFLAGEGHASTFIKQAATTVLSEVQPMPTLEPVQSWTYKSTALAAQTYVLAATSHDLATCIMEGFDGRRVKDILGIPDRYGVPLAVATGFDFHEPNEVPRTPRLGLEEVCFVDSFGQSMVLDEDNGGDDVHSDDDAGEVAAVAER
jgi:nitroreductase